MGLEQREATGSKSLEKISTQVSDVRGRERDPGSRTVSIPPVQVHYAQGAARQGPLPTGKISVAGSGGEAAGEPIATGRNLWEHGNGDT